MKYKLMGSINLCCTTYSTKRWAKGRTVNSEIETMERPSPTGWFYAIIKQELRHGWRTHGTRVQIDTRHSRLHNFFFNLFFSDQRLYAVTSQRLYINYRCYQITLRVKHFFTKNLERCEVLTIYLSFGFAGLAVTGRIRDTGEKVWQSSF
jgi:hypothetical protein